MSYLLELLAKGLEHDVGETVQRHLRLDAEKPAAELEELCREHPDQFQRRGSLTGLRPRIRGAAHQHTTEHEDDSHGMRAGASESPAPILSLQP